MNQPPMFDEPGKVIPLHQSCSWCDRPGIETIEIEPARFSRGRMVKRAITAPACPEHKRHIGNVMATEAAKKAKERRGPHNR